MKKVTVSSLLLLGAMLCSAAPLAAQKASEITPTTDYHFDDSNRLALQSKYVDNSAQLPLKDAVKDFGLNPKGGKHLDQSAKVQGMIDRVAQQGGARIYFPAGSYAMDAILIRSNIHLIFDPGVVIYPVWSDGGKTSVFRMMPETKDTSYIENCSISCSDHSKYFLVDASEGETWEKRKIRFATIGMVRNFSIRDMFIYDNFTTYCAISFTPLSDGISTDRSLPVTRPTNGEMIHCASINAHPGYGLCQLHGAQDLYFEDLYAYGGVTLRLETGANTQNIGVYNVFARNIRNENGRCALMMGSHVAQNGDVLADGIWAKSSNYAVKAGGTSEENAVGFKDGKTGVTVPGRFGDGTRVINVHSIYGRMTQNATKTLSVYDEQELQYLRPDFRLKDNKWFIGSSIATVDDGTEGAWTLTLENVTAEGYRDNEAAAILTRVEGDKSATRAIVSERLAKLDLDSEDGSGRSAEKSKMKKSKKSSKDTPAEQVASKSSKSSKSVKSAKSAKSEKSSEAKQRTGKNKNK